MALKTICIALRITFSEWNSDMSCIRLIFILFLVVKDSVSGTTAGVAAGMPVVGIATRNPGTSLINAGVSFVIKDFEDPKLWEALEKLEKKPEAITVAIATSTPSNI